MKLGLTMRVTEESSYTESRDAIAHDWYRFLEYALPEVEWYLIPNLLEKSVEMAESLALDGLILSGGNDIGESTQRDETETLLINYFSDKNMPVLGICRGLQMLYTHQSGQLYRCDAQQHIGCRHQVNISAPPGLQMEGEIDVNSYHNFGIDLSTIDNSAVHILAISEDGCVEGVLWEKNKFMGIMWHPERETDFTVHDKKLFRWFFDLED